MKAGRLESLLLLKGDFASALYKGSAVGRARPRAGARREEPQRPLEARAEHDAARAQGAVTRAGRLRGECLAAGDLARLWAPFTSSRALGCGDGEGRGESCARHGRCGEGLDCCQGQRAALPSSLGLSEHPRPVASHRLPSLAGCP